MAEKTKAALKAISKTPSAPATSADFQMKLSYDEYVDVVDSALSLTDPTAQAVASAVSIAGASTLTGGYHGIRTVEAMTAATFGPTAADSGKMFVFDGTACTVTLPAAAAGIEYYFAFDTTQSADAVITTVTANKISGMILTATAAFNSTNLATSVTVVDAIPASTNTLTFNGGTKGGVIGGMVHIVGLKTNAWRVSGFNIGSGTLATCAS
tara:strand:+ start:89 stop:721 length:633 start_codon:yes stop_codon:yes gene_type:complete